MVNDKVKGIIRATTGVIVVGLALGLGWGFKEGSKDEFAIRKMQAYEQKTKELEKEYSKKTREAVEESKEQSAEIFSRLLLKNKGIETALSNEYSGRLLSVSNSFNKQLVGLTNTLLSTSNKFLTVSNLWFTNYTSLSNSLSGLSNILVLKDKEIDALKKETNAYHPANQFSLSLLSTNADKSSLDYLTRDLYVARFLGEDSLDKLRDNKSLFFERKFGEALVRGAKSDVSAPTTKAIKDNKGDISTRYMGENAYSVILISQESSNGITFASMYKSVNRTNIADKLNNAQPVKALSFEEGTSLTFVDYEKPEAVRIEKGRRVYSSDNTNVMTALRRDASNLLSNFRQIYEQGPRTTSTNISGGINQNGK